MKFAAAASHHSVRGDARADDFVDDGRVATPQKLVIERMYESVAGGELHVKNEAGQRCEQEMLSCAVSNIIPVATRVR